MSQEPGDINRTKALMQRGGLAVGMLVRYFKSGEIARIAQQSGHDFLFIDTQHALFSLESIGHIAQTALACGITPLVRVRSSTDADISRLLDAGVQGVVIPNVDTAAQAREAVAAALFPPLGRRSVGGPFAALGFRPLATPEATRILNANTLVVCMVESREGARNLAEIAAVEGVDVIHLGCNDLLEDMGRGGAFDDPEFAEIVTHLLDTCRSLGKVAGIGGDRDVARQGRYLSGGARFVTSNSDIGFLSAAARTAVAALRNSVG